MKKLIVFLVVVLGLFRIIAYADDDFTPDEILVTLDPIIDFEFDYANPRFAWTDLMDGQLWIGEVDPQTGDFLPPSGKEILVDTDTVFLGNGPEWAATSAGPRIVYTKRLPNGVVSLAQATLIDETWVGDALTKGQWRFNPLASLNPEDRNPVILNLLSRRSNSQIITWRVLDYPLTERRVPMSAGATGSRWVSGWRALVFTAPLEGGGRQAFLYDCGTGEVDQLTFDSGRKQTIFMWQAPEFNDEYIFFTSVKLQDLSVIRVYRMLDTDQDGEAEWTVFKIINPPTTGIYFWSPEPFVHNGKSYIFMVASRDSNHKNYEIPTQIWLVDIDPVDPFFRNLSAVPNKLRIDPEVFVTDQGPFVYFNRYIPGPDTDPRTNEGFDGIYRVDTGLGPVTPPLILE